MKKTTSLIIILCSIMSQNTIAENSNLKNLVTIMAEKGKDNSGKYYLEYPVIYGQHQKTNKMIKQHLISTYKCYPDKNSKKRMSSETTATPTYLSKSLFSFRVNYDYYCGGSYPDHGTKFYIFDRLNHRFINTDKQFKNIKKFKQFLSKQFHKKYYKNSIPDCKNLQSISALNNANYTLLLTHQGIIIKTDYPHVARACEKTLNMACNDIGIYLKKNSVLQPWCSATYKFSTCDQ